MGSSVEALKKALSTSRMDYPYTVIMRNYLATNHIFSYRQTESYFDGEYCVTVSLYDRATARRLLFVRKPGFAKRYQYEMCYKEVFKCITSYKTQGLDGNSEQELKISTDDNPRVTDQKENLIIEGALTRENEEVVVPPSNQLLDWSTTEGTYEFTSGDGSIMARWMPLDSIEVSSVTASRQPIWKAKIIEDIAALKSINVLPIRGFMLGKFDIEFKMVLQATPFQACSLLLSWCPHPYGLIKTVAQVGVEAVEATKLNLRSAVRVDFRDYLDITTAVQRPNVILDVASGGEAVLRVGQKFHRTFIRNFDFDRVEGTNMGIRGGYQGILLLHQLTPVMVGTGTQSTFTARIFYRFVEAKLTAMTQPVEARNGIQLPHMYVVPRDQDLKFLKTASHKETEENRQKVRAKFRTQGPVMSALSIARGVGMTATGLIASVEAISAIGSGVRPRNRDKPNDVVGQVVVAPRPRPNFTNGEGIDSATVIGLSFAELTNVLENYGDEPQSYKDFVNINGLFTTFEWSTGQDVGRNLWIWNGHPVDSGVVDSEDLLSTKGLSTNQLFSPISIASSGFSNYAGTIKLYFQFVKTMFHKGAIEVSVQYGRELLDNAMENSYVKVINLQDCAGFEMIFPYIYDTPMRSITGSSAPMYFPSLSFPHISAMVHSARVTIRVLNKLVAPDSVAKYVKVLVWVKGGADFVLNYPRPYNTSVSYKPKDPFLYTPQVVPATIGQTVPIQRAMVLLPTDKFVAAINTPNVWRTQGNDFNEPSYSGNRLTNSEHMNFKSILKMPVKILKDYEYKALKEIQVMVQAGAATSPMNLQNYMFLPIAPISSTLLQYLDSNYSTIASHTNVSGPIVQSHQYQVNSMFGMFSGSLVYTVVVSGTDPVYYAYLPHDYSLRPMSGVLVPWAVGATPTFVAPPIPVADLGVTLPVQFGGDQDIFDLASSGIFNGMIIPQVNPTERIVVPMSAPLNWLLMNRGLIPTSGEGMYTMREQAEWFNGHLAFWSSKDCKVTVYLSAGDNFELGGFIGHVGVANPFVTYSMSDDRRERTGVYSEKTKKTSIKYQVQGRKMENEVYKIYPPLGVRPDTDIDKIEDESGIFRTQGFIKRDLTNRWKSLCNVVKYTALASGGAWLAMKSNEQTTKVASSTVAIYGTYKTLRELYSFGKDIQEDIQMVQGITDIEHYRDCFQKVTENVGASVSGAIADIGTSLAQQMTVATQEALVSVSGSLRESVSDVKGAAIEEIHDLVSKLFPSVSKVADVSQSIWQVTQHLVHVALAQQWKSAAWATFCILQELDLVKLEHWGRVKDPLMKLFIRTEQYQTQGPDTNTWAALMNVCVAMVCARLQVKADHGIKAHLMKIFCTNDYRSVSGLNAIMTLVRSVMTSMSTLVSWALKEKDPNVEILQSLQNQGGELYEFVEEANLFLTHFTEGDFAKRTGRIKHLATILRAAKVREMLLRVGQPQTTGPILALCNKVLDKAAKCQYLMKSDVVKMEPYVFYLCGNPQVGKSFLLFAVIPILFEALGIKPPTVDFIFTVTAGLDYCNGLRSDHLAWIFDDAWNLLDEESFRKLAQFLYALVTSAPFNVPRAELEHKEQLAQPVVVGVASNNGFPRHAMLACHLAIWRRRNCLWWVERADPDKPLSDYTAEELRLHKHLIFYRYLDVCDPESKSAVAQNFEEFIAWMIEDVKKHYAREKENQKVKYQSLTRCLGKNALDDLNVGNPFDTLMHLPENLTDAPITEVLSKEVDRLMLEIDRNKLLALKVAPQGQEVQSIGDCFARWTKWMENKTLKCGRCGTRASSGGVACWCSAGHYLCLSCANEIARVDKKSYISCPLHLEEPVAVEDCGLMNRLFSAIVTDTCAGWDTWYRLFKTSWSNQTANSLKNMALFIWGLRKAIKMVSKFTTQGLVEDGEASGQIEEIVDDDIKLSDLHVSTRAYKLTQLRPSQDRKSDYIFEQTTGNIPDEPYVCEHSLLHLGYYYQDEKFSTVIGDYVIRDDMCDGLCALADVQFLQKIKNKFQVSNLQLNQDIWGRREKWPRFFWPENVFERIRQKDVLDGIVTTPWWEFYVLKKDSLLYRIIKYTIPLLALLGLVWGCVKAANGVWTWISNYLGLETQSKGGFSGEVRTRAQVRRVKRSIYSTQQYSTDATENFNNKLNKITGNYILIKSGNFKCTAWGVHGSTFIMPNHLVSAVQKRPTFEIVPVDCSKNSGPYKVHLSNVKFSVVHGRDLAIVTIERGKILFRDCRKFLQSNKNRVEDLIGRTAKMLEVAQDDFVYDVNVDIENVLRTSLAYDDNDVEHLNENSILYNYQAPGMCGSLVCVDTPTPVVSIHISGSVAQNKGIGCILYQDDFETQGLTLVEMDGEPVLDSEFVGQLIGFVEKDESVFVPQKTSIIPSSIDHLYSEPPITMPAILDKNHPSYKWPKSPLHYGVLKNGKPTIDFPKPLVEKAYSFVRNRVLAGKQGPFPYKILTMEEAIMGYNVKTPEMSDDDEAYLGIMRLDTSAGWPYSCGRVRSKYGITSTDKQQWIQVQFEDQFPKSVSCHDFVIEQHKNNMEKREAGMSVFNVFQDCLKDERRPIEKAMRAGGTRLFSMSNIEGTIAMRRYVLSLLSHIRFNRISNSIAIGINPDSMEWTTLYTTLRKGNNTKFFTTDFTNFGAGLNYYVGMMFADLVLDFINKFKIEYRSVDVNVVESLVRELMGSYHIAGSVVYKTLAGSPSGGACTAEINSFVHIMYIVLSWLLIGEVLGNLRRDGSSSGYSEVEAYFLEIGVPNELNFTLEELAAEVVIVVYGDDGIFSISDKYCEYFNSKTINLVLKQHGIGVTDATKSEQIIKYTTLDKISFLKRGFRSDENFPQIVKLATMSLDTVHETPRWIRQKPLPPNEATHENCEAALRLIWGHGEEVFNKFKKELNSKLEQVGINPILLTWCDIARQNYPSFCFEEA